MTTTHLMIAWALIVLGMCVLTVFLDWLLSRPRKLKKNRRVLPKPYRDDRDSIELFKRMYPK